MGVVAGTGFGPMLVPRRDDDPRGVRSESRWGQSRGCRLLDRTKTFPPRCQGGAKRHLS